MYQIEVKNLTYVYSAETLCEEKALNDINLGIKKGEFIGLIGQTGSGKSTLAKQLNAILKPTTGNVFLDGVDIWKKPKEIQNIRFRVGMVFQYPEHQIFEDSVYKEISFGPRNMGLSETEIERKVYLACNFVGLDVNLLYKSPFNLSGGEKRKIAIAGIVAMEPEVLILDEPTAGLDPKGRQQLLEHLKQYHDLNNKTIILISHNMEDIVKYTDKVAVLNNGKLEVFDETRKVFLDRNILKKIRIKPPQIITIMSALKEKYVSLDDNILTVDEAVSELLKLKKSRSEGFVK